MVDFATRQKQNVVQNHVCKLWSCQSGSRILHWTKSGSYGHHYPTLQTIATNHTNCGWKTKWKDCFLCHGLCVTLLIQNNTWTCFFFFFYFFYFNVVACTNDLDLWYFESFEKCANLVLAQFLLTPLSQMLVILCVTSSTLVTNVQKVMCTTNASNFVVCHMLHHTQL